MEFSTPHYAQQPAIDAYGDGGFRLGGERYEGSLLLCPDQDPLSWSPEGVDDIGLSDLQQIIKLKDRFDVLIIGTGSHPKRPGPHVRNMLEEQGLSWDSMTTGAAARTYNVLLSEHRRVAALLIAVS